MAVVEQPVEDCRCCKLSGKQFIPSAHWQVGGDDEGAFFISLADDLKKQALSFSVHFYVGQFIYDQEIRTVQLFQHLLKTSCQHLVIKPVHKFLSVHEKHLSSGGTGISSDTGCYHAFSHTGRPDDYDVFFRIQEMKFPEFFDPAFIQGWIEAIVDIPQC